MESSYILLIVLVGVCCLAIGYYLGARFKKHDNLGNLVVVNDPREGPYIFLETSEIAIEELEKKKTVELTVVTRDASRK